MATILITGAGRGIGRALTDILITRGHDVIATVRNQDQADALMAAHGNKISVLLLDVTDTRAIMDAARTYEGKLDILINNAGIIGPERQHALDMDFDGFAEVLEVNTLAPLMMCQAFLPHLKRGDAPRILTVSSQKGRLSDPSPSILAYSASKAALNKVMQGLAIDLKPENIAVQMVHPGWVRTDMGGDEADISVQESAEGLADRAEQLTFDMTGSFVNYDGAKMQW